MQCLEVRELLSPYLDGVISFAEQEEISAHLAVCPNCRAEFEILCEMVSVLKNLPELSPSAGFSTRVLNKATALPPERRQRRSPGIPGNFTRGIWVRVAALAAAFVFTFGIAILMQGTPWPKEVGKEILQTRVDRGQGEQGETGSGQSRDPAVCLDHDPDGNSGPGRLSAPGPAAFTGGGTIQGGSPAGDPSGVLAPAAQPEGADLPAGQNTMAAQMNIPAANHGSSFADTSRGLDVPRVVAVKEGVISKKIAYGNVPPSSRESEQKIVRNATLHLDVEQDVRPEIEFLARNSGVQLAGYSGGGALLMKVPADQYENVVNSMHDLGRLTISKENEGDISSEYTAYETRLKELAEEEQILLEAMEKSGSPQASDVEEQLIDIRQDMEYQKKQLSLAEYSTIELCFE
jgi:hypothetical protein